MRDMVLAVRVVELFSKHAKYLSEMAALSREYCKGDAAAIGADEAAGRAGSTGGECIQ